MRHLALAMAAFATFGGAAWAHPIDGVTLPIEEAAAELSPNQFVWNDLGTPEPVSIVVSLMTQRAYVYRGQTLVAASTISSGMDGKDTPAGTYQILQKEVAHKSNLYNDASMPYMQRLTWDGIAIHAGRNPGFPDSHGCIRVPTAFAKKLFAVTAKGTTVLVTDGDTEGPPAPQVSTEAALAVAAE